MNNWLNKLERKYGRFGIPNLTNILVAGQILVFAIELFIDRTITAWVGLNRFFLLQGQIWRAITFVFIPFSGGSILSVVLGIYFTWFVGTALERSGAISAIPSISCWAWWARCWPACLPA